MKIFTRKIAATPRRSTPRRKEGLLRRREGPPKRRGPPRRGHAYLGELGDSGGGLSGPTTSPRWRHAIPKCACDCLGPVFVACFVSVSWPDLCLLWLASWAIV